MGRSLSAAARRARRKAPSKTRISSTHTSARSSRTPRTALGPRRLYSLAMFARWGRFVYRRRWAVLVASVVLLALSVAGIIGGGTLVGNGGFGATLPAGQAAKLEANELHPKQGNTKTSEITLIFSSPTMVATATDFKAALEGALAPLQSDSRVSSITTPYTVPPLDQANLISRDGHEALVIVNLNDSSPAAQRYYQSLVSKVRQGTLQVVATGQVPLNEAFNGTLEADLQRAEYVALPITLLMLVLIFAAVVAAGPPLSVGLLAIVGGVGGTLFLARFTDVSQYAINVVTLIGLASPTSAPAGQRAQAHGAPWRSG